MHVIEAAVSQTAVLPFKLWMSWQWPLYFLKNYFLAFQIKYMSYLWHLMLFLFLQRKNAFIRTAVVNSHLSIPTHALTLWWQRGRMKLYFLSGNVWKWTWILSFHEEQIPKVVLIHTSCSIWWTWHQKDRRSHREQITYICTYILCPLLCQSNAIMWDMLEQNVESSQVFRKWGCSVFFQCYINKAWLT